MKARFVPLFIGLSLGCSNLADSVDPKAHDDESRGGGKGSAHGGAGSDDDPDGMASGASVSKGGKAGASVKVDEPGGGVLALGKVTAQVVGRNGDQVRFNVTGTQPASRVSSIAVSFEGDDGKPRPVFDSDWDGVPDSADGRVVLDAPLVDDAFTASATLSGVAHAGELAKARVALVDGADNSSSELEASITPQALPKLGEDCDPAYVADRCSTGQSCTTDSKHCSAGLPPAIVELKYLHATGGPVILARGSDPDDDMGALHIELLDAQSKPVTIDPDSNPTTAIDTLPAMLSSQGNFFSAVRGGLTLDTQVSKVRVTPVDALGHQGASQIASVGNLVRAGDGSGCDARGFVGCGLDDVCSPGLPVIVGRCVKQKSARAAACSSALKLDPSTGVTVASGLIDGSSLWDPPKSCTNAENVTRPEGVVRLHLATESALTVSTRRPETNVDTVLYVLPGCPDDASAALDCNDDALAGGYASELKLAKVPAGDYTIVIESGQVGGGSFGLSVTTE